MSKYIATLLTSIVLLYSSASGNLNAAPTESDAQPTPLADETIKPIDANEPAENTDVVMPKNAPIPAPSTAETSAPSPSPTIGQTVDVDTTTADETEKYPSSPFFTRGKWDILLVWDKLNEKGEEILIMQSVEKSKSKRTESVLGLWPLPSNLDSPPTPSMTSFPKLWMFIDTCLHEMGNPEGDTPIYNSKYKEEHPVYLDTLSLTDLKTMTSNLETLCQLKGHSGPVLSENDQKTLEKYQRDYDARYIMVERKTLHPVQTLSTAMAWCFSSDAPYCPILAGRIGASGFSFINLVMITPEKPTLPTEWGEYEVIVDKNFPIEIETNKLQLITPEAFDFLSKVNREHCWLTQLLIRCRFDMVETELPLLSPSNDVD